jgi:hypothetical protein
MVRKKSNTPNTRSGHNYSDAPPEERYFRELDSFNGPIPEEVCAVEYWWNFRAFERRREELEAMLEPFVTTEVTDHRCRFRGVDAYLAIDSSNRNREYLMVTSAQRALHCLRAIEAAVSAGDIVDIVNYTYGFARHDFEVEVCRRCGCRPDILVGIWRLDRRKAANLRQKQAEGPKKRKLLTSKNDLRLLKIVFETFQGQKNLYKKMGDELFRHGLRNLRGGKISADTIERRCKDLGFWRNSTVAP